MTFAAYLDGSEGSGYPKTRWSGVPSPNSSPHRDLPSFASTPAFVTENQGKLSQ